MSKPELSNSNHAERVAVVEEIERHVNTLLQNLFEQNEMVFGLNRTCYALSVKHNYTPGLCVNLAIMALEALVEGRYRESLALLAQSKAMYAQTDSRRGFQLMLGLHGLVHNSMADYEKAVQYALQALSMDDGDADNKETGFAHYVLATIHLDMQQYADALKQFERALHTWGSLKYPIGRARTLNGMGAVYLATGNLDKALECQSQALAMYEQIAQPNGISRSFNDLAQIYEKQGEIELATHYYNQALSLRRQHNLQDGLITSLLHYGRFLISQNKTHDAFALLSEGYTLADELGVRHKQAEIALSLSQLHKQAQQYKEALYFHEVYHHHYASIHENELQNRVQSLEMRLQAERTAKEREIFRLRNEELSEVNSQLNRALNTIHDSIDYARSIQQALMPNATQLAQLLPRSFIFYQPKDVVSGDFYWLARRGDATVVAVVDCTGHGVPGAFMSLLGINMLNQIVRYHGEIAPQKILEDMNRRLQRVFGKSSILDGMEAAIVTMLPDKILFGGAGIPLYHVREGTLTAYPGSKHGLGGKQQRKQLYTQHEIDIAPKDTLYLFSDGFKDQLGWHHNRRLKFSTRRFTTLLAEISAKGLPIDQQQQHVEKAFVDWRGAHPQIDDVLVMGIEL